MLSQNQFKQSKTHPQNLVFYSNFWGSVPFFYSFYYYILSSIAKPLLGDCGDKIHSEVRVICSKNDASQIDRKGTRLHSSHVSTSYAVFCLKKEKAEPMLLSTREQSTLNA